MSARVPGFESLTKYELRVLCDRLLVYDPGAVEACVAFMEAETFGLWHGRARAMMGRRLKHCPLSPSQRERVASAVLSRLVRGQFSEGFRDQLRLVLLLEPERAFATARRCRDGAPEYIRRYAAWVLAREAQRPAGPGDAPDSAT